jgi:hypothetical protein
MVGSTTGVLGVVGLVLSIAGVWGAGIPIVLIIVALACFGMFRATTS